MNKRFIAALLSVMFIIGVIIFVFIVRKMSEKEKDILFVILKILLMILIILEQ